MQQSESSQAAQPAQEGTVRPPSWRAQVQELEHVVNAELRDALAGTMLLLADQVKASQKDLAQKQLC